MRRALLACSLLGAAFTAIQGPAHAQTAYTPNTWSDDLGGYWALESLDLKTGAQLIERDAPLVIPTSTRTTTDIIDHRRVYLAGVITDAHAYFMGYEKNLTEQGITTPSTKSI